MYPILVYIGNFSIRIGELWFSMDYGRTVVVPMRLARREGIDPEKVIDFAIYAVVGRVLEARLWETIFGWEKFAAIPNDAALLAFNIADL